MGDCTVPRRAAFLIRIFTGRALFGHVTDGRRSDWPSAFACGPIVKQGAAFSARISKDECRRLFYVASSFVIASRKRRSGGGENCPGRNNLISLPSHSYLLLIIMQRESEAPFIAPITIE